VLRQTNCWFEKEVEEAASWSLQKRSGGEDSGKESNHNNEFDDECKPKRNSSLSLISVEQIQSLIADVVNAQLGGDSCKTHLYRRPYTKRINAICMPHGYQPPKFQQFNNKGNPNLHITHFIETFSNAGTKGDLLMKQFVRSLKGLACNYIHSLVISLLIVGDKWKVSS